MKNTLAHKVHPMFIIVSYFIVLCETAFSLVVIRKGLCLVPAVPWLFNCPDNQLFWEVYSIALEPIKPKGFCGNLKIEMSGTY